jgi:quercetin dioxygenase-like cupin family protein
MTTTNSATSYVDLAAELSIPADGTLSRTIYADGQVKVVLFGLDAGQELSEHTAAVPAIVQVLRGEARLTLGGEELEARVGAWAYMPARLPHSVRAETPLVFLLTMLRGGAV